MKNRVFIASLMVLLSVALFSCGGGGGVPGSDSGDTNIIITSVSVTSATNHDIDVFADTLTRAEAVIAIGAKNLNPNLTPFPATVTQCKISYSPAQAGAPGIATLTIQPACTILEGSNNCPVTLIDIQRKQQYWIDINKPGHDPNLPTHYVAEYRCDYENSGGAGNFPAKYDIWLADFGEVPTLAVFPDAATIAANGGSAVFLITGGIPPYQLSVDNLTLVDLSFDSPSGSFTVTGKNNGTGDVIVTVRDSSSPPLSIPVTVTLE